ncbi:MAG: MlaE family ABC transporter permease [Bdellovibrionales bacterium]
MSKFVKDLFGAFFSFFHVTGGIGYLTAQISKELVTKPFYLNLTTEQIYLMGVRSFFLVFVTAISTGAVMAMQFGAGLEKFGGKPYIPAVISLSIVRELGPVFASLVVAGRVGAGIASEIGSMVVTQQIDAIRALGTSHIKKIVIPRVLALLIALPLLSIVAIILGVFGGFLVGVTQLSIDPGFYYAKVIETLKLHDFAMSLGKTIFFSLAISIPSCYFGLTVKGGTKGVGIVTTKAVVTGSILIFLSDFVLTKLFLWMIYR